MLLVLLIIFDGFTVNIVKIVLTSVMNSLGFNRYASKASMHRLEVQKSIIVRCDGPSTRTRDIRTFVFTRASRNANPRNKFSYCSRQYIHALCI